MPWSSASAGRPPRAPEPETAAPPTPKAPPPPRARLMRRNAVVAEEERGTGSKWTTRLASLSAVCIFTWVPQLRAEWEWLAGDGIIHRPITCPRSVAAAGRLDWSRPMRHLPERNLPTEYLSLEAFTVHCTGWTCPVLPTLVGILCSVVNPRGAVSSSRIPRNVPCLALVHFPSALSCLSCQGCLHCLATLT